MKDYKNILWIEDVEDNNAKIIEDMSFLDEEDEDENINYDDLIKRYFGDEQVLCVQLETQYRSALKILEGDCNRFDLIVFDLNFNQDKDDIVRNYDEILDTLKKGHISPQCTKDEFILRAGYYLYLYLAMRGYPTDRMVILTGNANNYQVKYLDLYLQPNVDIIEKTQEENRWLKRYYLDKKNEYYRIRRLVFQACEYWKSYIENLQPQKIPFNNIYYSKKNKTPVPTDVFIDMLDHIQMLFPVTKPDSPRKIYYQAMQTASSLHEESADIKFITSTSLKKYHSCIRNFRNWTAHNKFHAENKRSLDGEQFALLFCIAMRTYFDTGSSFKSYEKPEAFSSRLLDYEKLYDFNSANNVEKSVLSEKLMKIWLEISQNIGLGKSSLSLDTALREYGKMESADMLPCHLFLPLWCSSIIIDSELLSKNADNSVVRYTVSQVAIDDICREIRTDDTNSMFMLYSYRFILSGEV